MIALRNSQLWTFKFWDFFFSFFLLLKKFKCVCLFFVFFKCVVVLTQTGNFQVAFVKSAEENRFPGPEKFPAKLTETSESLRARGTRSGSCFDLLHQPVAPFDFLPDHIFNRNVSSSRLHPQTLTVSVDFRLYSPKYSCGKYFCRFVLTWQPNQTVADKRKACIIAHCPFTRYRTWITCCWHWCLQSNNLGQHQQITSVYSRGLWFCFCVDKKTVQAVFDEENGSLCCWSISRDSIASRVTVWWAPIVPFVNSYYSYYKTSSSRQKFEFAGSFLESKANVVAFCGKASLENSKTLQAATDSWHLELPGNLKLERSESDFAHSAPRLASRH